MIKASVTGIPDLRRELQALVPKLRKRALRNALASGARIVRDEARSATRVISPMHPRVLLGQRKPGTVRRALSVRTSKLARRAGNVGVFVNVRPAKAGARGTNSPDDPFYWRWLTAINGGERPLQRGANKLDAALREFIRVIGPVIQKLNRPRAPTP